MIRIYEINWKKYFNKSIKRIVKIHGEKYDNIIEFSDNSEIKIQNKKIECSNSRGDSYDRRKLVNTFNNQFLRKYLAHLCLFRPSARKTNMEPGTKKVFIKLCESNMNDIKNFSQKNINRRRR